MSSVFGRHFEFIVESSFRTTVTDPRLYLYCRLRWFCTFFYTNTRNRLLVTSLPLLWFPVLLSITASCLPLALFLSVCCFWHSSHFTYIFLHRQFSFKTFSIVILAFLVFYLFFLVYSWQSCFANYPSISSVVVSWIVFDFYRFFVHSFPKMIFIKYLDPVKSNFIFPIFDMFSYSRFLV